MFLNEYIKKATPSDVDAIVKLYDDVNECYTAPGWGKGLYPSYNSVMSEIENESLYIFIYGNDVLGACIINHEQHPAYAQQSWSVKASENQVMVIHDLVSHPNYRRKGIGQKLVEYSINLARQCNAITIRLDTHFSNIQARSLYKKCGFIEISQWTGVILGIQQTFSVFEYII